MVSTFTPNRNLEKPAHNDYIDTWDVPVNRNSTQEDFSLGGITNINVTGLSGTIILGNDPSVAPPAYSYICPIIILTGTLTANLVIQFPAGIGGNYTVYRATTGTFGIVFTSGGGGASIGISPNASALITSTGVDILIAATTATGSSNSQVLFNKQGVIAGDSHLTFDTATNALIIGTSGSPSGISINGSLLLNGASSGTTAIRAAATTVNTTYTWPPNAGSAGAFLTSDGGGGLSWSTLTSGVSSFSAGGTGLSPGTATTGNVTLGGVLNIGSGGTAANSAAGARANLGVPDTGGGGAGGTWAINISGTSAACSGNAASANIAGSLNPAGDYSIHNLNATGQIVAAANIYAAGDVIAFYSDDRLKTQLGDIEDALEKICSLPAFYYEPNDLAVGLGVKRERRIGTSAQAIQKIAPEMIRRSSVDPEYMTYLDQQMIVMLIAAIKELRNEVRILTRC